MTTLTTPPLGDLVRAGDNETAAVALNDFIFMSRDVSNAYLVTGGNADVLINAGTVQGGPRHRALFAEISAAPIVYAIVTQSHADHYGGLEFFDLQHAKVVVQKRFSEGRAYRDQLGPFYQPRNFKLWGPLIGRGRSNDKQPMNLPTDVIVEDSQVLETAGRRFEIYSVPGGETLDSLVVWLPRERIVFTGNLFGPMFLQIPNLYTIRGDKTRSSMQYLRSLERVLALEPTMLITGHGDPIIGAARIKADLTRMKDAVAYMHDRTIEGMNEGKDVRTLRKL